jgi:predicted dehydrogenase
VSTASLPGSRLAVGLIGGGGISDTHARAVRACPGAGLAGVYGANAARVRALAAAHGVPAFERLDEFLAHRPMDAVIVGSPSGVHAAQGIAAAARGLHVLVEKPIDVTTDRADELIAATGRAGVVLGVIVQDRVKPALVRLRAALHDGSLGTLLLASARVKWYRPPAYYAESRWRGTRALDGGAALINQGIHTVDLLRWLLGPVARVKSLTATRWHAIGEEDVALALVEFESGAVASLEATTCAYPGYPRRVELTTTEGTVVVEGDDVVAADLRAPRPDLVSSAGGQGALSAASPAVSDIGPFVAVVADFVEAVRTGRRPVCDGWDGRETLALVETIYADAGRRGPRA